MPGFGRWIGNKNCHGPVVSNWRLNLALESIARFKRFDLPLNFWLDSRLNLQFEIACLLR